MNTQCGFYHTCANRDSSEPDRLTHIELSGLLLDGLDSIEQSGQPAFNVPTHQAAKIHFINSICLNKININTHLKMHLRLMDRFWRLTV